MSHSAHARLQSTPGGSRRIVALLATSATAALAVTAFGSPASAQDAAAKDDLVGEIVVTGTSIRGIAPTGSPVIGVDRQFIQSSGVRTTADLLSTVPQIAQFNQLPTGSPNFGAAVAQVSLRPNLGTGATLVLVNGRRIVPAGLLASRTDVSIIPPAAIARVEVIPDGASAIYGSDAVAGVINFITRRDLNGAETSIRYSSADSYSGYDLSQSFGRTWSGGSFSVTAQYIAHSRLRAKDRPFYSDANTVSPGLSTSCPTASIGAANPRCDAAQIGGDIQPADQRGSVYANLRQDFSPSVTGWAELIFSRDHRDSQDVQPALPGTVFSAANPFNRTGANQTVFYRPVTEYGTGLVRRVNFDTIEGSAGVDIKLPHEWAGGLFGNYGKSRNVAYAPGTNNVLYQRAMASTNPATAFDPFGHQTSAATLSSIFDAVDLSDVTLKLGQLGGKFDGPLFALPGGQVRAAVGSEWRYEAQSGFRTVGTPNSALSTGTGYLAQGSADTSRKVGSLFGELFVPIVGSGNAVPLVKDLSLSLAARYDHYNDFGGTTNPKIGASWKLSDDLRLFGNWSTSFQAPNLGDTFGGAIDTRVQVAFGGHPFQPSGGALSVYTGKDGLIIAGGSSNLKPQTSKNYAFGFDLSPSRLRGFRATATYYHVNFKNFIGIPFPGTFTIPSLQQYGILAPIVNGAVVPLTPSSPQVTQFTSRLPIDGGVLPTQIYWIAVVQRVNVSSKIQSGVDYDISQRVPLADGVLTGRVAGTIILRDKLSGAPGAAFSNVLPTDSRSRYTASLSYVRGPVDVGLSLNHLSHRFSAVNQSFRIAEFDLFNLRASYTLDGSGLAKGIQLSLNIDNLFDRPPPVQRDASGGHATNYWMLGRMVTVGMRKRW